MSAWEHPSKDLFRQGRGAMAPTTADRERVRARLAAKLGAAAVGVAITTTSATAGGATAGAATATASKGGALLLAAKIAVPALLIGGVATIVAPHVIETKSPAPTTTVAPIATVAPAPVHPPAPAPVETATVSVADLPTVTPVPIAVPSTRAKTSADPAEEARMVAAMDDALRAGDGARALALADEHAKKFPSGVLVEEREGGRAVARCMNGSRASADSFLAAHPKSPMRGRIVAACGEEP